MSSEFTLDIQLTELGFSRWNLCDPLAVKDSFLSTAKANTQAVCQEPEDSVCRASAENCVLLDHPYFCPFKIDSVISTASDPDCFKTSNAEVINSQIEDNKITKEKDEQSDSDDCLEVSSVVMEESVCGEERTNKDTDFDITDEDFEVETGASNDEEVASCLDASQPGESERNHCNLCNRTFPAHSFQRHLNTHTGLRPYRCNKCRKQFCHLANYRTHIRSHLQSSLIHCRVCLVVFETEEQLLEHLDSNHFEEEFYQCDFCQQIFTDFEVCKAHVEMHRQQVKRHMCLKCGSSFSLYSSLLHHLQFHNQDFSCSKCERTFTSKASLLRHLDLFPFTCMKCRRHFRLRSQLKHHSCELARKNIQCKACLVFFQNDGDFENHKTETGCLLGGPSKIGEFHCMECNKVFSNVEELKKHSRCHQRVLKCSECGMSFHSSVMLTLHMGGHAAQQPVLCQDCGLGFPHQQGFDSHLNTCGQATSPVAFAKKKKTNAFTQLQKTSPVSGVVIQPPGEAMRVSNGLEGLFNHLSNQSPAADGQWKLTLDKEPPPGVPLVMVLPVQNANNSFTSSPILTSLVLQVPSSSTSVVSKPLTPSSGATAPEPALHVAEDIKRPKPTLDSLLHDKIGFSNSDSSDLDKAERSDTPEKSSSKEVNVDLHADDELESGSVEVEITDEDSGVDVQELHECVSCGQLLAENNMIQHYMDHATATHSESNTSQRSCSPLRKKNKFPIS